MTDDNFEEDGNALWQLVTSEFVPLKRKKPLRPDAQENPLRQKKAAIKITPIIHAPLPVINQKIPDGVFKPGDSSRIDGSIARKLKEGRYPIDATLDLHGRTQDEAFAALRYCVTTAYGMGKRCLLVITGKGIRGEGVLREQLPKWLATAGLQEYILTIHRASQQHGGTGAFYVLLRKNRGLSWTYSISNLE